MNYPENIKIHPEHTWIKVEGTIGTIGITDFAQSELGEIVYVDLPNLGKVFCQDEVFGTIEALKTVSDLFCPITCSILEVNKNLIDNPTLVNSDPFGEGWLIKVNIREMDGFENLQSVTDYTSTIN